MKELIDVKPTYQIEILTDNSGAYCFWAILKSEGAGWFNTGRFGWKSTVEECFEVANKELKKLLDN